MHTPTPARDTRSQMLLAAHLGAGLRVLALEFLPWRDWQKSLAAGAAALTVGCGLALALAL